MQISTDGLDFTVRQEGFVSRAYRDPTGTWTIGTGFTNGSAMARQMLGRIRAGMTITREQNDRVLAEVFATEYGPAAAEGLGKCNQAEFDAGCDYAFNCGTGAIRRDRWTAAFRGGSKARAARLLRDSRVTSRGRRLQGLVDRRADEAVLLRDGHYGNIDRARSAISPERPVKADDRLMEYQQGLAELGYDPGPVDGWHGPKTSAAVKAFQKHHPSLVNDGVLGPATRAQIDRDLIARRRAANAGAAVAAGGIAAGAAAKSAPAWGHLALVAAGLLAGLICLVFVLRQREEITHWIRNAIKGA